MKRGLIAVLLLLGLAGTAVAARITNRQQATAKAQWLMSKFIPPPGAAQSSSDPSGGKLRAPFSYRFTPDLVDLTSFWSVSGNPHSTYEWIKQHPPSGSKLTGGGTTTSYGKPYLWEADFTYGSDRGRVEQPTLVVQVTAAQDGGTAIRVDAQAMWVLLRPRSERVPNRIKLVMITSDGRPNVGPLFVTDPATVRRIVTLVNRLPAWQPGVYHCPRDTGPLVRIAFRRAAHDKPVAVATADGSGCGGVGFELRGHQEPPLTGGAELVQRLGALLEVRLSPYG